MTSPHQVLLYEELAMNAHPALRTQLYDGWVLRFSNGYTNRANSVNPIYASSLPRDEKIGRCEAVYRRAGLPAVFKLTRELSGGLDAVLEGRGYQRAAPTDIMATDLTEPYQGSPDFHAEEIVTDEWADSFFTLNGLADGLKRSTARQMLGNIQNAVLCGRIEKDSRTAACGLCVIERGFAGLFDIVVAGDVRGKGFGYALCTSLLGAARAQGASSAYLQVVQSNVAAIGLYKKLGFEKLYEYWYRVKGF